MPLELTEPRLNWSSVKLGQLQPTNLHKATQASWSLKAQIDAVSIERDAANKIMEQTLQLIAAFTSEKDPDPQHWKLKFETFLSGKTRQPAEPSMLMLPDEGSPEYKCQQHQQ